MSQSHPRRPRAARAAARARASGSLLAGAGALVLAALVLPPWLASRLTDRPYAPALAVLVALPPALYLWFRRAQQAARPTAATMALLYAALAAAVLWLWGAR